MSEPLFPGGRPLDEDDGRPLFADRPARPGPREGWPTAPHWRPEIPADDPEQEAVAPPPPMPAEPAEPLSAQPEPTAPAPQPAHGSADPVDATTAPARTAQAVIEPDSNGQEYYDDFLPERSRRGRSCLAALVVLSLLLGTAGAVAYFFGYRQVFPGGTQGADVAVEIPKGVGVSGVADTLEAKNVISSALMFRIYVRFKSIDVPILQGDYTFRKNSSAPQAIDVLRKGPKPVQAKRFTVPEGHTLADMAPIIAGVRPELSAERFRQLATDGRIRWREQPTSVSILEGLLHPDTYEVFTDGLTEEAVIRLMLARFEEVWAQVDKSRMASLGLTPYEVIVLASLVEAEAKVPEDRRLIASVIYNRLEVGNTLDIDATILYVTGREAQKDNPFAPIDKELDSPYNTYRNAGLPPTPIAAPGRASIEAALNPADTEFFYYILCDEGSGKHCFTTAAQGQGG